MRARHASDGPPGVDPPLRSLSRRVAKPQAPGHLATVVAEFAAASHVHVQRIV